MSALIIVDVQNDFMPGGALAVKEGNEIIPEINDLMDQFDLIIATQDWHPKDHISFAKNHHEKAEGDVIELQGHKQILWPVHCVQETKGADFAPGLFTEKIDHIFYKGTDPNIDSYSTFFDNAHLRKTGLESFLKNAHIKKVTIVGVATEYCVLYSVLDALELGFQVDVIPSCCRGINPMNESVALDTMQKKGAHLVRGDTRD